MNFIVINGKRSTLIRGLMICTLPPISKPLLRTQIDVIDGRDGDLITPLGYSAYDKEFQIGLHGLYDVDEVIAFFDSEGAITFSNEPTKYYRFKIYEQIDFERLIRFKTATVKLHVQPFKFSAVETAYTQNTTRGFSIPDFRAVKNGLTVESVGNVITFSGTPTIPTEIYVPINPVRVYPGYHTLLAYANASGSGADSISGRLTMYTPADANTFGGSAFTLINREAPVAISENTPAARYLNTLYFYVQAGTAISTEVHFSLTDVVTSTYTVTNTGNVYARPTISVTGRGTVTFQINGGDTFTLQLGAAEDDTITIDAEEMDAYTGTPATLRNRDVSGDYARIRLRPGENEIKFVGDVYSFSIEKYSRWL